MCSQKQFLGVEYVGRNLNEKQRAHFINAQFERQLEIYPRSAKELVTPFRLHACPNAIQPKYLKLSNQASDIRWVSLTGVILKRVPFSHKTVILLRKSKRGSHFGLVHIIMYLITWSPTSWVHTEYSGTTPKKSNKKVYLLGKLW